MRERLGHLLRWSVLPVLVGLLLAGLGPFGSFAEPFWRRALFWVPAVWINWLLAEAAIRLLVRRLPQRLPARTVTLPALGSLAIAAPATGIVFLIGWLVGQPLEQGFASLLWKVLLVTLAIALPGYAWSVARSNRASDAMDRAIDAALDEISSEDSGGFERRRPKTLNGRLLFLEMEDHYLRIHTTEGSDVILCRMEDAAHELGQRGLRVHRSYWVATDAVAGARRDGQSWRLRLVDGREVPVGRTYKPAVRAVGWLERA
jgi:hypothetical protein